MQTRWMLYMEDSDTLKLLPGIPRRWLDDGNEIILENMASYFGPVSISLFSDLENNTIRAIIRCNTDQKPATVMVRIPHPATRYPVNVTGGKYDQQSETVTIESFSGEAEVILTY